MCPIGPLLKLPNQFCSVRNATFEENAILRILFLALATLAAILFSRTGWTIFVAGLLGNVFIMTYSYEFGLAVQELMSFNFKEFYFLSFSCLFVWGSKTVWALLVKVF